MGLAGCTDDSLSEQARSGDQKGYVQGDGTVTEVARSDRGEPVDLSGRVVDGSSVDLADWRGDPVVLNTWFAACGPCRAEAADLAAISEETAADGVRFLGINTDDGAAQADAFARQFGITYPSLLDTDGKAVLALRGEVPPMATPTTLVLDRQGRVASRIIGKADPSVLRTLISDVVAEGAATPSPAATAG